MFRLIVSDSAIIRIVRRFSGLRETICILEVVMVLNIISVVLFRIGFGMCCIKLFIVGNRFSTINISATIKLI